VVQARAEPVSPALVCTVHDAIRTVPWSRDTCAEAADALNATTAPVTLLALAVLESDMRPGVTAKRGRIVDVGLLGVACAVKGGRCSGGQADGLTVEQLKDPRGNIAVGGEIWAAKVRTCKGNAHACWRGLQSDGGKRKTEVAVIVAAFGGVMPKPGVGERVRRLAEKIARAVNNERKS
jgi:hypothetical protein